MKEHKPLTDMEIEQLRRVWDKVIDLGYISIGDHSVLRALIPRLLDTIDALRAERKEGAR